MERLIGLSGNPGMVQQPQFFEECRKAGIGAVEVSTSDPFPFDFADIRRRADAAGVTLWSYHLPFAPFETINIASEDAAMRTYSVKVLGEDIRRAGAVGITKYIIHPSAEPNPDNTRAARMACAQESLAALAQVAAEAGGVLCVEDLPRTCLGRDSSDILKLLEADGRLRVCFDTNHLLSEKIPDFVTRVGDKIVTTHISDYDFVDEKHWLPGEGGIDWKELVAAMDRVGYTGPWLYEVGFKAPPTIKRPRDLVCADITENAYRVLFG